VSVLSFYHIIPTVNSLKAGTPTRYDKNPVSLMHILNVSMYPENIWTELLKKRKKRKKKTRKTPSPQKKPTHSFMSLHLKQNELMAFKPSTLKKGKCLPLDNSNDKLQSNVF
jgi:hypothetical protein